jgi:hypothetical protein
MKLCRTVRPSIVAIVLLALLTAAGRPALADGPPARANLEGARFSWRRVLVTSLAGAAAGGAASYATFEALCDPGSDCFGTAFVSLGASFAVTPLATWASGKLMDGEGTLLSAYLGGSVALASFGVPGPVDETPAETLSRIKIQLAIASILMPISSSLIYEISSHRKYLDWLGAGGERAVAITPLASDRGVDGVFAAMVGRF